MNTSRYPKHLIVIPVHNDPLETEQCLKALAKNTDLKKNKLCVVDDGSNQETKKLCENFHRKYPQIKVLRNKRNLGKPKSINNVMFLFPDMDYYTIIDNDVVVKTKNWPKILFDCHKDFNNKAILGAFTAEKGYAFIENNHHYYDPYPFLNLAGRFFSIPKKIFRKLGYFYDKGFRHEDAEYCRRAAIAGFRWYYIRDIKAETLDKETGHDRKRILKKDYKERKGLWVKRNKYLMRTHNIYYLPKRFRK